MSSEQLSVYSLLFHEFYDFLELNFFLVPTHMNLNLINMPCPSSLNTKLQCKITPWAGGGGCGAQAQVSTQLRLCWLLVVLRLCAAAWAEHSSCTNTPHGAAPGQNKAAAAEAGP